MRPRDFWSMSLADMIDALQQFYEYREESERAEWIRMRWQTAALLSVHTKKGQQIKPTDLVVFPWEKGDTDEGPILDRRERFERFNRTDKYMKKKYGSQRT